jgi:hypothetical protein
MARFENGDLKFIGSADSEFRDAFDHFDQGRPSAARRKLLAVLTDRLNERKNYQLYPTETSAVS